MNEEVDEINSMLGNIDLESSLLKAVRKQVSKELIIINDHNVSWICPECKRSYTEKIHIGNYCDNCGQKLNLIDLK